MNAPRGVISSVAPESIADELGIRPGDQLVSISGHPIRDIIDYRFYSADEDIELVVARICHRGDEETAYRIEMEPGDELGLEFESPTFDGIRRCNCRCTFCFVQQMPPGMRRTLYVRDDDYRYSFLFGNFITLSNLTQEDWDRLAEQRLSPLYVSVHATDLELRRRLMGMPNAPDIVAQLKGLGQIGIEVHAQVVLVPGLNDGDALNRTISDLAALYPTVQTIAVVPVGITRYHRRGLVPPSPAQCAAIVEAIEPQQAAFRESLGVTLAHLSDEFYLSAGKDLPPAESYDGFLQLENGVGLTRQLLDEWADFRPRAHTVTPAYRNATVVCGTLIAPTLDRLFRELGAAVEVAYRVLPVVNRFFGATVTVSGLLVGEDVVSALRRRELGDLVILPRAMFDAAGERTLDDMTLADMQRELGIPVKMADTMEEVVYL